MNSVLHTFGTVVPDVDPFDRPRVVVLLWFKSLVHQRTRLFICIWVSFAFKQVLDMWRSKFVFLEFQNEK